MKRPRMLALLLAGSTALSCLSVSAQADDETYNYGREGWWSIDYHDYDERRLCFAGSFYKGANVRVRFLSWEYEGERKWAISLTNPNWKLKKGTEYKFTLDAPRNRKWNITFKGLAPEEMIAYVSKDVMNSIAMDSNGSAMRFHAGNSVIGPLSLNDSAAAIRATVHCVRDDPNRTKNAQNPPKKKQGESHDVSSGTGFFVAHGQVLTSWHVVKDCKGPLQVRYPNYKAEVAYTNGHDDSNDLVLLETKMGNNGVATFRRKPKLGEAVATYGFPLSNILAPEGNFTMGNITSTTGLGGDSRYIQYSAPIQAGNSGGPLLDTAGQVIGVINGTLKQTEEVRSQNVNFAISASVAVNFLEVKEVSPRFDSSSPKLEPEVLAERAKKFSVQVFCK
jgi:serine protease Do